MNRFQTVDGLLFVLTLWMDKVIEERENVQEMFENLKFYIDNFKPVAQIDPEHRDKVLRFLNQAYECHLKQKSPGEDEVCIPACTMHKNMHILSNMQILLDFVSTQVQ